MNAHASVGGWEERFFEAGELLLNGWGYNWYRSENLMRADDVLLRNHAEQLLGEAEAALQDAGAAFRRAFLPPPSRENPLPDAMRLTELRIFNALLAELERLRTAARGASMPPDDKIWRRHGDERDLLDRLGRCDALLAGASAALRTEAVRSGAESVSGDTTALRSHIGVVRGVLEQRRALLAAPAG